MCICILHKKALRRLVTGICSIETSHRWKTWEAMELLRPRRSTTEIWKKTTWLAEEFKTFLKIRWSPCKSGMFDLMLSELLHGQESTSQNVRVRWTWVCCPCRQKWFSDEQKVHLWRCKYFLDKWLDLQGGPHVINGLITPLIGVIL